MKNIGIVTTWFERGAAYVSRQFRDLLRTNYNVYIYARAGEKYAVNDPEWDDSTVTWGKKASIPFETAVDMEDFQQWIEKNEIDMVLFNEQRWWEPVVYCCQHGIKTVAYIDYYTEETIPMFGCYDVLICNTKRHYEAFKWHSGAIFIPWGTNIELFKPSSEEHQVNDIVRFFHSCGMDPQRKGTDLVLAAFAKVKGNAKLIIHSQCSVMERMPYVNNAFNHFLNSNRLEYIERTVAAPGLYSKGDVYVYPSRIEGIGLTIAEALSSGLPVITTDNAPMNEFISLESGKLIDVLRSHSRFDGYYWPVCVPNHDTLAQMMQYYVDHQEYLSQYKKMARIYAEKHLDWSKNAGSLFENLKRIFAGNSSEKRQFLVRASQYDLKRLRNRRVNDI